MTALLQYRSEQTSRYFADAAKNSSDKMEDWTAKMHAIAVRTEQETLSMHVITIFTLIFLPGTFISVRLRMILAACVPVADKFTDLL